MNLTLGGLLPSNHHQQQVNQVECVLWRTWVCLCFLCPYVLRKNLALVRIAVVNVESLWCDTTKIIQKDQTLIKYLYLQVELPWIVWDIWPWIFLHVSYSFVSTKLNFSKWTLWRLFFFSFCGRTVVSLFIFIFDIIILKFIVIVQYLGTCFQEEKINKHSHVPSMNLLTTR